MLMQLESYAARQCQPPEQQHTKVTTFDTVRLWAGD